MTNKKLFTEFSPVTANEWIAQVVKDLKGENFDDKLGYISAEGIKVKPFYTAEDLEKYKDREPLFSHTDWEVCVEIDGTNEVAGNVNALHQLNSGATALVIFVRQDADLKALLNEIGIEYIAIQFVVEGDAAAFKNNFDSYINSNDLNASKLRFAINTDPVENLLRTGDWRQAEEADKEELLQVSADKKICINGNIYHNAGASSAYEVACLLAHANQYLKWADDKVSFQLNVAVGGNYFFEIAKLRALRKVFALLLNEYGLNNEIYIHAETATRNLTVFDAHNNLLRTTTAAMAASIGGCDSMVVKPFDVVYNKPNEFSERLARNIQLILKSESYLDKVADVSAGSFFIEELTEQIAEKAWNYFIGIEKHGGLIEALKSGSIQEAINAFASTEQQLFDEGKNILIGTNKFPNTNEDKQSIKDAIDYGQVSRQGKVIETLSTIRLSEKNEKERLSKKTA